MQKEIGIVCVLTNPAMPNLVKIGYTANEENTTVATDIVGLDTRIAAIAKRQNELRRAIDAIVNDLKGSAL